MDSFEMNNIDKRLFRELIISMENEMETLKDSDVLAEWGFTGIMTDFKFVGEFRQWAGIWLDNLGTPMDEEDAI